MTFILLIWASLGQEVRENLLSGVTEHRSKKLTEIVSIPIYRKIKIVCSWILKSAEHSPHAVSNWAANCQTSVKLNESHVLPCPKASSLLVPIGREQQEGNRRVSMYADDRVNIKVTSFLCPVWIKYKFSLKKIDVLPRAAIWISCSMIPELLQKEYSNLTVGHAQ